VPTQAIHSSIQALMVLGIWLKVGINVSSRFHYCLINFEMDTINRELLLGKKEKSNPASP